MDLISTRAAETYENICKVTYKQGEAALGELCFYVLRGLGVGHGRRQVGSAEEGFPTEQRG